MAIVFHALPGETMLHYLERLMKMDPRTLTVDQKTARVLSMDVALRSIRKEALNGALAASRTTNGVNPGPVDPADWFYARWDQAGEEEREAITFYISFGRSKHKRPQLRMNRP